MSQRYMQSAFERIHERSAVPTVLSTDIRDRPVPSVPPPAVNRPTDEEFYVTDDFGTKKPDHAYLKDHFFREGRITEDQAMFILETATKMLREESNIIHIQSPVTICGDIHGQYYDLMKMFSIGGSVEDTHYLFLGDYVDRGSFGIECLLYIYSLKIWFPSRFTLLRGNHECRHLTEYFSFQRECYHKYSPRVYEACIESFCALPLAAVIDRHFFCVHGGISPELIMLDDLIQLNRFQEPGSYGLLCDLLWSDPIANFGHEEESSVQGPALPRGTTFVHNGTRGCSFFFTYEATCQFLARNKLMGIIRGHEAQDAGYTMYRKTPNNKFPSVITIFSAPNYCDVYHNRGAILKYANKNITIRQYNSSPHPYWLPNFMDAFTWSLPFVAAKITEMLLAILSICTEEELVESETDAEKDTKVLAQAAMTPEERLEREQRIQQIKNKILAVGRMQRVFQLLREEAETATEFVDAEASENLAATTNAGKDKLLGVHETRIARSIRSFDDARRSDLVNERLPEVPPTPSTSSMSMFPASMRLPGRRSSGSSQVGLMDLLIKQTLEEGQDTDIVERLAECIARERKPTGRPMPLKRHETAL